MFITELGRHERKFTEKTNSKFSYSVDVKFWILGASGFHTYLSSSTLWGTLRLTLATPLQWTTQ
jgi:hypothetical protein